MSYQFTNWVVSELGDVCNLIGGGTPSKKNEAFFQGDIPWATVRDMKNDVITRTEFKITKDAVKKSSTNIIQANSVVIATRVGLGKICFINQDTAINQDLRGVIPKDNRKLDVRFLFWWLKSISRVIEKEGRGATVKGVKLPFVKSLQIPLPSPSEQKRIVAILDEAFPGIDAAIANTEKNLASARELFKSYLNSVFTQRGEGWTNTTLGELCTFTSGGTPSKKNSSYWVGDIPWVSARDLKSDRIGEAALHISDEAVRQSATRIAPVGSLLMLVRGMGLANGLRLAEVIAPCAFNQDIRAIQPPARVESRFLVLAIMGSLPRFEEILTSAAHGTLKIDQDALRSVNVPVAPHDQQKRIIGRLDAMREKYQSLEFIYQQKLNALNELKQSLLQKAFSGELTSDNKVIAFPDSKVEKNADPFSPEFTAKILAFAYHRHAAKNRHNTFGHVKTQKTLHLVESIGGVELGRKPIKDAAGPNDFQHMLNAEVWAKENQFFEFVRRGEDKGYDFKKLLRYDELMAGVFATIKPYQKKVERIIDLIIPKKSRETELIATVHAAWNNLILDGCKITDEAILREARENWHPDKLKIPLAEFQQAIRFIRDEGIIPDGKAKRVTGQENLF